MNDHRGLLCMSSVFFLMWIKIKYYLPFIQERTYQCDLRNEKFDVLSVR